MGFIHEKLWDIFLKKVVEEDATVRAERQVGREYIAAVQKICEYGVDRAKTIRDTFPMFTLHDETHICNVMQLMCDLLGDDLEKLTRDEAAMLIMAACCHDIGMSYGEEEKEALFHDIDRLNQYLENNHSEYVKAFSKGCAVPMMTDDMMQNYLRCIHHERVMDLLCSIEWPTVLDGKVDRQDLICVCQSHGKDISSLDEMEATATIDLRFCAILLRLADILDFDTSRAPETVYEYSGFHRAHDAASIRSKEEWDKHLASQGFDFLHIHERVYMYPLDYNATCKSMQVEQTVNCYIDWVDQELNYCSKQLKRFTGKWQDFILPGKIQRNIKSQGYVSGQYRLSLDQDKILELLIGKDLYSDPSVFVRELIQNAIDAVRTREQLDKNLPSDWKGQINIRCWMDQEGYHWFRIEDNGIGMSEEMIMNYFLKIGSSYYASDTFSKSKLQCNADSDYMPISRFGIGILSCFMGDEQTNQVEVSTKHFKEGNTYYPALRLSMHGINGYYYLSNKDKSHIPGPMKGVTQKEKQQYLTQAGTVIAVRTNLYQTRKYKSFKEIVDKYVIYPPVSIHYDGDEGSCDYPTETEFMDAVHAIHPSDNIKENGLLEFPIPDEALNRLHDEIPQISFDTPPRLLLKCISLEKYTSMPFLKGALLTAKVMGSHKPIKIKLGKKLVEADIKVKLHVDKKRDKLGIEFRIVVDNDFERQMQILETQQRERGHDLERKMELQFPHDELRREVLYGITENCIGKINWKEYIQETYGISEEKINETINEMTAFMKKRGYFNNIKEEDIVTLEAFKALQESWIFEICSLSAFAWYNMYFKNIINKTGTYSVAAHNGILCGDASFFFRNKDETNLATIILLKDKYRPDLDVARDGVRGLPLETASEIEIIKRNLTYQGFSIAGDMSGLRDHNYPYIVMADYCKLLGERDDLTKQLIFETSEGALSNGALLNKITKDNNVIYESCPALFRLGFWYNYNNDSLYEYLCAAFLRDNYLLQIKYTLSGNMVVLISKKEKELPADYMKQFPACFFCRRSIMTALF
ncbi:MAG: hypothetical protein HFE66_07145 [Clostridiales bacterium]|jgi:hypothetical protein|nr:hypothetical protein [Clostridiales bacterium]